MGQYVQVRELKAYVQKESIAGVLCRCIEHNVVEFTVADDRGGSGMWMLAFGPETPRKTIRAIVGPLVPIEVV